MHFCAEKWCGSQPCSALVTWAQLTKIRGDTLSNLWKTLHFSKKVLWKDLCLPVTESLKLSVKRHVQIHQRSNLISLQEQWPSWFTGLPARRVSDLVWGAGTQHPLPECLLCSKPCLSVADSDSFVRSNEISMLLEPGFQWHKKLQLSHEYWYFSGEILLINCLLPGSGGRRQRDKSRQIHDSGK